MKEQEITVRNVKKPVLNNKSPIKREIDPRKERIYKKHYYMGNQFVQRMLIQFRKDATIQLDDETTNQINQARSDGYHLENSANKQYNASFDFDFGNVRIHSDNKSDALNRQLNAKAFTTGQDIFFRDGAYQPNTTEGQQLIAHELTHVVQQANGAVGGSSSKMTVNPPNDRFEREADTVAKEVVGSINSPPVQRQVPEEEEEELQTKAVYRQAAPEEEDEEILQRQEEEDEEELNA